MNKIDAIMDNVINNQAKKVRSWLKDPEMMGKIVSKLSDDELQHLAFQANTEFQARHDERAK